MAKPETDGSANPPAASTSASASDPSRSWVMVGLTALFVLLYAAALLGWLHPISDDKLITHLEPIIFVIVGYYFGRVPSAQTEKSLKDEAERQAKGRATAEKDKDSALRDKAEAEKKTGALEQKIKSAKATLASAAPEAEPATLAVTLGKGAAGVGEPQLRQTLAAAARVLDA